MVKAPTVKAPAAPPTKTPTAATVSPAKVAPAKVTPAMKPKGQTNSKSAVDPSPAVDKAPAKKAPVANDASPPKEENVIKPVKETAKAIDEKVETELKAKDDANGAPKTDSNAKPEVAADAPKKKDEVPAGKEKETVFCWSATEATAVQVAGSFNDWKEKLDMKKRDGKYEIAVPLKPGKYTYKFVVDGEWCYDFVAPNEKDADGNVNNVIMV